MCMYSKHTYANIIQNKHIQSIYIYIYIYIYTNTIYNNEIEITVVNIVYKNGFFSFKQVYLECIQTTHVILELTSLMLVT